MRYYAVPIIFTALLVQVSTAQPPDTTWTRTYDYTSLDVGKSIQTTVDGGFVIAGYCRDSYYDDFLILRLDSQGSEIWALQAGEATDQEAAYSVKQTMDGGFIVAGETSNDASGIFDFWLVKTDSLGSIEWDRKLGTTEADHARDVIQTPDGGYILAGYRHNSSYDKDVVIVKTDDQGYQEWITIIQTICDESAESIVLNGDNYIAGGWRIPPGDSTSYYSTYWINSAGSVTNQEHFGGGSNDFGNCICRGNGGGVIVAGYSYSFGNGSQGFVGAISETGSMLWSLPLGGPNSDAFSHVQRVLYDGYIAAGSIETSPDEYDAWLVKINDSGYMEWENSFDMGATDYAYSAAQTLDGGFALCGSTGASGDYDVMLIRIEPPTGIESEEPVCSSESQLRISVNPAGEVSNFIVTVNEDCYAELGVYDTAGRLRETAYSGLLSSGSTNICMKGLPSGLYIARLSTEFDQAVLRFTVIR